MKLLIVESPTKTKNLSGYLGKGWKVAATVGHIRDLPKSKMGVEITKKNGKYEFEPQYIQVRGKAPQVNEIRALVKEADEVILATDPDREGEAIAWHVLELMKEKGEDGKKFKRVVFHSITKEVVLKAMETPGKIDMKLVEAQQARRILDKIVGFRLSPVLWNKVRRGLSAGRVQSVAVRLVFDKEKEIEVFKADEYWVIGVDLLTKNKDLFTAVLEKINGSRVKPGMTGIGNEKEASKIKKDLEGADYVVERIVKKARKAYPRPPFKTSTLQQAAANRLGWSARKTMSIAQSLYEHGNITYHRTDSLSLVSGVVGEIRSLVSKQFGKEYVPEKPRGYKSGGKVQAQEAHEAIRPTSVGKLPDDFVGRGKMASDEKKLYQLIWQRTVASQMAEALYDNTRVDIKAGKYLLVARGEVEKFDGWKVVYKPRVSHLNSHDSESRTVPMRDTLPELSEKEKLDLEKVLAEQKFTQPPARYNDASLIRELEKRGIGRPSTYAPTITKIIYRRYVERREKRFFLTDIGRTVTKFLVKNFPDQLEYEFTAQMEKELDEVATKEKDWQKMLSDFYGPFDKKVLEVEKNVKAIVIPVVKTGRKCSKCGKGEMVVKTGRFGEFIACDQYPACKNIENIVKYLEGVSCEKCGARVVIKKTKKGREFYGCEKYPKCDWASWKRPVVKKEK
ncbi:type I DNA topoisomerase [Patescibacteria group bacterium]|nr:type I DNA topoisomerase [Patescibacteria group bacterium]MBU1256466.1 type I DNA topoisomerase [Patescibacteria group bacterium]MBU1457268.1 type I DNA topoisomerase [Patescibacteria group bacterium]